MAKETVVAQVGQPTSENEIAIRQEVSGVTIQVEGMVISSEDDFEEAAKIGLAIKAQAKKVAEFFAPMKKRASDAHKEICNREKMMLFAGNQNGVYLFAPASGISQGYKGDNYGKTWIAYRRPPERKGNA